VLLALTLSNVNPRVGRSGNLVFALFAFVVYFNLLNLGQSWIGSRPARHGRLHAGAAWRDLLARRSLAGQAHNNWGLRSLTASPA
jgi:lipopolysaccharide export system permease protein